jgi:hypothetical protein
MDLSQVDHVAKKPEQAGVFFCQVPVDPTDIIVLAIGIVVALLGATELISGQYHGNPL